MGTDDPPIREPTGNCLIKEHRRPCFKVVAGRRYAAPIYLSVRPQGGTKQGDRSASAPAPLGVVMTDVQTRPESDPAGPTKRQLPRGLPVFAVVAVAILAFLAGASGGSYQGKLVEVQKNDNASYLPGSAESTKVLAESGKFNTVENVPGFMVFHRASGLTAEDRAAAAQGGRHHRQDSRGRHRRAGPSRRLRRTARRSRSSRRWCRSKTARTSGSTRSSRSSRRSSTRPRPDCPRVWRPIRRASRASSWRSRTPSPGSTARCCSPRCWW